MSKKKKKKVLQGMEHLSQEIYQDSSAIASENREKSGTVALQEQKEGRHLKKELFTVILIMVVLFGVLAVIMYFDSNNDFLRILAEKLTNWY